MSQTFQLYILQQIDTKLDNAHARLQEIDAALKSDAALKRAEKKTANAKSVLQKAQLALKRAEEEVQEQQNKIANNQKTLYSGSVTNPKELEDLQNEAEALKRYLQVLEDRQLEKMIAFEEAESAHQAAEDNLGAVQQQVAQEHAELGGEQSQLQTQAAELEIEREKAVAQVDEEALKTYNKLRQSRHGLAVSLVENGICTACGATLTAAQAQAVRSPSKINTCSSCGRVQYSG